LKSIDIIFELPSASFNLALSLNEMYLKEQKNFKKIFFTLSVVSQAYNFYNLIFEDNLYHLHEKKKKINKKLSKFITIYDLIAIYIIILFYLQMR
jgi:amino acid permease